MDIYDISTVAKRSGIPASTLRYYEDQGLISSIGRRGLRRLFGPQVFVQLSLITLAKTAGFSLEEISRMFGSDGQPQLSRPQLLEKADEMERQIQRLGALRDVIQHVAHCPAPDHMECPTFLRLLKVAARRRASQHKATPSSGMAG